jgi:hypothetical protein
MHDIHIDFKFNLFHPIQNSVKYVDDIFNKKKPQISYNSLHEKNLF